MFQAVSFKANNSQLRVQLKDMKDDKDESGHENENYIETLEKDIAELKETHQATIVKLRQEHQREVHQYVIYNVIQGIIGQNLVFLQYGHCFQYSNLQNKCC